MVSTRRRRTPTPESCTWPPPRDLTSSRLARGSTPSLKEAAPGPAGSCAQGQVVPRTDCERLLPGSLVFQRTGRGGRSVTSGSGSQAFPATSPLGRSSRSLLWPASVRTSALGRRVSGGCGLLPFPDRGRRERGAHLPICPWSSMGARAVDASCGENLGSGQVLGRRASPELQDRPEGGHEFLRRCEH